MLQPFPLSEKLLCSYLADQGLAPQTGKSYLSALQMKQISLGLPDPRDQSSFPKLKRVQAGISQARLLTGSPPRVHLPITVTVLSEIQCLLASSSNPDGIVIWAVSASSFFSFFRLAEILPETPSEYHPTTSLAWGDASVDRHTNLRMVQFRIKMQPVWSRGKLVVGRTGSAVCPVTVILRLIELRGGEPSQFFTDSSGCASTNLCQVLTVLNVISLQQDQYAGHSFRIRAATTAAAAGVEDSTIQTLGRWRSAAFLQYIRTPKEHLAALSAV